VPEPTSAGGDAPARLLEVEPAAAAAAAAAGPGTAAPPGKAASTRRRAAAPEAPVAVRCPSCGAGLDDGLAFRTVRARGERRTSWDALVFHCGSCGTVLGVSST
jgi:hypothetical protein